MFDAIGTRPRLIVIGPEVDRANEPVLAKLARGFETCIVGDTYSTWSASYADTHRACAYREYDSLFGAVTDLMGEVPFSAVLTLDSGADHTASRVCEKLGLVDTSGMGEDPAVKPTQPFVVAERRGGRVINAYRVSPHGAVSEPVVFDVPGPETHANVVSAYESGSSEPLLVGLSSVVRSGLLNGLADCDLAYMVAAAYDLASRELMTWLEPVS